MILAVVSVICRMPRGSARRDRKCVRAFINLFAAATAVPMEIVVRLSGPVPLSGIKDHVGLYVPFIRSDIGRKD